MPSPALLRPHVTALLTSHNRQAATLRCLASLLAQRGTSLALDAVLVDDASSDGTAAAVGRRFPSVRVISGDGTLFWARGMARAERAAVEGDPDYLLWLNDDVVLDPDAVQRLLQVSAQLPPLHLMSGSVRDPLTGETSYGGVRRRDWHPLRFELAPPGPAPQQVDTVHGNVLLVPRAAYLALGGIDGAFAHAYADFDYGLRLRSLGGQVVLAPGHFGTCAPNHAAAFRAADLSYRDRWRLLIDRKGLPPRSHIRYLRRHGGAVWPVVAAAPFVRALTGRRGSAA